MSAFADDVAAVVHALRLKKIILVGHSMGGSVIVYAAHRLGAAVAGLVGVDTWSNLDQAVRPPAAGDPSREDQLESLRHDFKRTMDTWVRTMFIPGSNPELVEPVVAAMSAAPQQLVLDVVTWMRSSREQFQKSFDELRVPKHAIGTDSFIPRSVETARRHGIHLVKMTGVGHFLMMEDAATFNRHLEAAIAHIIAHGA